MFRKVCEFVYRLIMEMAEEGEGAFKIYVHFKLNLKFIAVVICGCSLRVCVYIRIYISIYVCAYRFLYWCVSVYVAVSVYLLQAHGDSCALLLRKRKCVLFPCNSLMFYFNSILK